MSKHSVSRRHFLATTGASSAVLVLSGGLALPAATQSQVSGTSGITPALITQLAEYSGFPLAPEQAPPVTGLLSSTLAAVRGLRPPGYDALAPAAIFRVPAEG